MIFYVYELRFPNGKVYVGQTNNIRRRFEEHRKNAEEGVITRVYAALRKYGVESVEMCIIEECSSKLEVNEREVFWIESRQSMLHERGYNLTRGGDGGDTFSLMSPEAQARRRNQMKLLMIGNHYGDTSNPLVREKIREAVLRTISKRTEEQNALFKTRIREGLLQYRAAHEEELAAKYARLSQKYSGQGGTQSLTSIARRNNCTLEAAHELTPAYGRVLTAAQRRRVSEVHKGKKVSAESREKMAQAHCNYSYLIKNENTGEEFATDNLFKWCKEHALSYSLLVDRCSKVSKSSKRKLKEWSITRKDSK